MLRVAIVGSGVSGTVVADYLSEIHDVEVHVFDCGLNSHSDRRHVVAQPGVKKYLFGSDWPYWLSAFQQIRREFNGLVALSSHAFGGLTSIWGANCEVPGEGDVESLYLHPDYFLESCKFVEGRLNVNPIGTNDSLHVNRRTLSGQLTAEVAVLHTPPKIWRSAKLAIKPEACVRCGNCMSGCVSRAIYNARDHLSEVRRRPNVSYFSNHLLVGISGSSSSRILEFRHAETGEAFTRDRFDLIVLGMGPIEVLPVLSTLLKSDYFHLEDSQKFYGIAIRRRLQTNTGGINLSNLVCTPVIEGKKVHLQVYPGSAMAFGMSNSRLTKVFKLFANLFVVYVIYCDGSVSSKITARFNNPRLEFSTLSNTKTPSRLKAFLGSAFHLLKIGLVPLPIMVKAVAGHSQHFGATSYFSRDTDSFSPVVNEYLQLQGHPDILIADATSLRTIPALPTTIISLINAIMAVKKAVALRTSPQ